MSKDSVKQEPGAAGAEVPNTTVFVRSIPFKATSEELSDFFSEISPIKHCVVVTDRETNESKGFGFVKFAVAEDAAAAIEACKKTKFQGRLLRVDLARRRQRADGAAVEAPAKAETEIEKRRPRLIVRNLPWSIRDPEQLRVPFSKYGKVTDVVIPRTAGGKMSGFAFVTMRKKRCAELAIAGANGMTLGGRQVAVDYAVQKDVWQKHVELKTDIKKETYYDEDGSDSESESEVKDESDDEIKDELDADEIKLEDVDESEDDDEGDDDDDDEDDEDDEDEEDWDDDEEVDEEKLARRKPFEETADTTVFIRNLSYTANGEQLKEHFAQFGPVRYAVAVKDKESGQPRGTAFVCFRHTNDARACVAGCPKAVAAGSVLIADDSVDQRYVLDGRVLSVAPAVDRSRAEKLAADGVNRRLEAMGKDPAQRDKRHLFLLEEGRIKANSDLAGLISRGELELRTKSYNLRRQQLSSNPSLHLSLTRVAIRNVPRTMTEAHLKALARKAIVGFAIDVKEGRRERLAREELDRSRKHEEATGFKKGSGVIKQAKIIMEQKTGGVVGRSRGYGFVEFATHRLALMGLRWLNGHEITAREIEELDKAVTKTKAPAGDDDDPAALLKNGKSKKVKLIVDADEDLKKRRLVVEFAIENVEVVNRRREREKRARERVETAKTEASAKRKRDDEAAAAAKKPKVDPSANPGQGGGQHMRWRKKKRAAKGAA
ncbi:nucleolar protein 4 [Dipodascopsis tothii]|uniref:nucleolar protein 4 n=1 Tax=Dipodascopsis tothii TaxID=44089 RepID=UPI0034CE76A3